MTRATLVSIVLLGILLVGSLGFSGTGRQPLLMPNDSDKDGVPDPLDLCPSENASFFDRNGDGCIDDASGARHIEFWGADDMPFTYVINSNGAPQVSNGSDFTAIQAGMGAWAGISGAEFSVSYGGTTQQQNAAALDLVNLVTFKDNQYQFGAAVIAVGIATSFTVDSLYEGKQYRPGQIVDADMIFNPVKHFKTPSSGGQGTDIQSVVTHEAGHLFGISHSPVRTSTMFYVLPPGTDAASLEGEDELVFLKAYPTNATLTSANRISGTVSMGVGGAPVPGAIVFAMDAASGDTAAADYSMPDGSYTFIGLADGSYYVAIHAIDESSAIGYMKPRYVNALVETTAVVTFPPEYYDAAESSTDDPAAKLGVAVSGGSSATGINIITNTDTSPPTVVKMMPGNNATSVQVDAAVMITFSEPINYKTIQGNFGLVDVATSASIIGTAVVLNDDSVIAFTPTVPFDYEREYDLTLKTGLKDKYGNGLAQQFTSDFVTEPLPPLAISSLAPNKGVVKSIVVINGNGFDWNKTANIVRFGTVQAGVLDAFPNRLIVTVPQGAETDLVTVEVGPNTSNGVTFTILSAEEVARGYRTGVADLNAVPRALTLLPNGGWAYVATESGASAIVTDPGLAGYLTVTSITITGGLDDIDAAPDGKRVYGVSRIMGKFYTIDTDPSHGPLFNTVIADHGVGEGPLGIAVDPGGRRAFVPTDLGRIQVWDVKPGSATFEHQIGLITPPVPGVRGEMAIDPAGERLLAITGSGKLLVYDLGPDTLLAQIPVLPDPKDVIVDATGTYAYVSDGSGNVSAVYLESNLKIQDITTGGSLRGMTATPGGMYLYAVNRELNLIDVIDVNIESNKFRSVVATIEQPLNPVDVESSPDGFYAFSVVEGERQFIVTTIGLGPTLRSLSKRAGPPGTMLVLAGDGFGAGTENVHVTFPSMTGPITEHPAHNSGTALTATVPELATSGPVFIAAFDSFTASGDSIWRQTNPLYFQVLDTSVPPGGLRLAQRNAMPNGLEVQAALAMSPTGDFAAIGGRVGEVFIVDTDANSATFNQFLTYNEYGSYAISDVAISPDGMRAFIPHYGDSSVWLVDVNRHSTSFMGRMGHYTMPTQNIERVVLSPDGELLIASDGDASRVYCVDVRPGTPSEGEVLLDIVATGSMGIAFHPDGRHFYVADFSSGQIFIVSYDFTGGYYIGIVNQIPLPGSPSIFPLSLAFTPDGSRCLVLAVDINVGLGHAYRRYVVELDTTNPEAPSMVANVDLQISYDKVGREKIDISPRGDRAIAAVLYNYVTLDLTAEPDSVVGRLTDTPVYLPCDMDFTPDGSRFYVAAPFPDSLYVYDFSEAAYLNEISGDGQVGVIEQPLAAPLRVEVIAPSEGPRIPVPGVPITFQVTGGGGFFAESHLTTQVIATDQNGYAEIDWNLGPVLGGQQVIASSIGLNGTPIIFSADAVPDPETLPLQLAQMIPLPGAPDVSVTTAIQGTFSRAVDIDSITDETFFIHKSGDAAPVSVAKGFAGGNRKATLMPLAALDYGTTYNIEATSGIAAYLGGPLQNPGTFTFTTAVKPPLMLASVTPPSGSVGASLVLSGNGFDATAANNKILFNGAALTPFDGGVDYLKVRVPLNAITGAVRVASGSDTSNAMPFVVLIPTTSPVDEVLATVGTGTSTKSVAVTPDGALAYSVSPNADVVVPIDVGGQTTYASISVGDNPLAIAIHPEGTYAYVANSGSASVSVICVDPDSLRFNTVVQTINVGTSPVDVAVGPDGDRVFVANAGSNNLSVIDGDEASATHHSVVATVGTGSAAKSVIVTPDGSRVYVGTDAGFVVLDALTNAVVATVGTGSATKSVAITPDGALLIILTTEGTVLIVDVQPGSATENEVVGTVTPGTTVKSVAVTPDGAILWIILEDSDVAIAYSLTVVGASGSFEPGTIIPPPVVSVTPIDTIPTGQDPSDIAFDPSGTGLALICNAGDKTITFLNASGVPAGPLMAEIEVTPHTLNLRSNGRWVTGRIELAPAFFPEEIDIGSVLLQHTIHAESEPVTIEDHDGDGVRELVVKFDRAAFQALLPQGDYVEVTITGDVRTRSFSGLDTIRTIRPVVKHPNGGVLAPGEPTTILWDSPAGYRVDSVSVEWSHDNGETWTSLAHGIPDSHSLPWPVPMGVYDKCRIMVILFSKGEILGMGMNQNLFLVGFPIGVTVQGFAGAIENEAAVIQWSTILEQNVDGFNLLRSEDEGGRYERMNAALISSRGSSGGSYDFRDTTIALNREYYYELEQVSGSSAKVVFGPYKLVARAPFSLAQNVPNPFNPTTTIKFTVPEDNNVRLVVYDASGRRVRTLVDGRLRADFYRVQWDGKNDAGRQVSSGVYFYRIQTGRYTQAKKMLLLR